MSNNNSTFDTSSNANHTTTTPAPNLEIKDVLRESLEALEKLFKALLPVLYKPLVHMLSVLCLWLILEIAELEPHPWRDNGMFFMMFMSTIVAYSNFAVLTADSGVFAKTFLAVLFFGTMFAFFLQVLFATNTAEQIIHFLEWLGRAARRLYDWSYLPRWLARLDAQLAIAWGDFSRYVLIHQKRRLLEELQELETTQFRRLCDTMDDHLQAVDRLEHIERAVQDHESLRPSYANEGEEDEEADAVWLERHHEMQHELRHWRNHEERLNWRLGWEIDDWRDLVRKVRRCERAIRHLLRAGDRQAYAAWLGGDDLVRLFDVDAHVDVQVEDTLAGNDDDEFDDDDATLVASDDDDDFGANTDGRVESNPNNDDYEVAQLSAPTLDEFLRRYFATGPQAWLHNANTQVDGDDLARLFDVNAHIKADAEVDGDDLVRLFDVSTHVNAEDNEKDENNDFVQFSHVSARMEVRPNDNDLVRLMEGDDDDIDPEANVGADLVSEGDADANAEAPEAETPIDPESDDEYSPPHRCESPCVFCDIWERHLGPERDEERLEIQSDTDEEGVEHDHDDAESLLNAVMMAGPDTAEPPAEDGNEMDLDADAAPATETEADTEMDLDSDTPSQPPGITHVPDDDGSVLILPPESPTPGARPITATTVDELFAQLDELDRREQEHLMEQRSVLGDAAATAPGELMLEFPAEDGAGEQQQSEHSEASTDDAGPELEPEPEDAYPPRQRGTLTWTLPYEPLVAESEYDTDDEDEESSGGVTVAAAEEETEPEDNGDDKDEDEDEDEDENAVLGETC